MCEWHTLVFGVNRHPAFDSRGLGTNELLRIIRNWLLQKIYEYSRCDSYEVCFLLVYFQASLAGCIELLRRF